VLQIVRRTVAFERRIVRRELDRESLARLELLLAARGRACFNQDKERENRRPPGRGIAHDQSGSPLITHAAQSRTWYFAEPAAFFCRRSWHFASHSACAFGVLSVQMRR